MHTLETTQDFFNLFVDSTGELLYFIAIFVSYQAALLMALDQHRRSETELAAGRYVVALVMAELAWLALMSGALYEVAADDSTNLIPPLERMVNAIVLVFLSWGLLTAEHEGKARGAWLFALFLTLILIGGFAYTLQEWNPDQDFNTQDFAISWTFIPLLLAGLSILLLIVRYNHVADIPLKLLFFLLIIAGHAYTLTELVNEELTGDAAGAVRWSHITGSALVLVLVYRLVMDRMTSAFDEVASYAETISKPLKAIPVDQSQSITEEIHPVTAVTAGTSSLGGRNTAMELLKALGIMLDKEETEAISSQIVMAVGGILKADIAAIFAYEDANWADILAAYNHAQHQAMTGVSLNLAEQPTLINAIETKRMRELDIEQHGIELLDLYTRLDITQTGPTYLQPLTRHGKVVGVLIVGQPFTRRKLRTEELRLLESIGPIAARLLVISRTALINRIQAEERAILEIVSASESTEDFIENTGTIALRREMQESLEMAQNEIDQLNAQVKALQQDLASERNRIGDILGDDDEATSITQRIETISQEQLLLQNERRQLVEALKEAQATLAGATADDGAADVYESVIDTMKREISDLKAQKERLEHQLTEIRAGSTAPVTQQLHELLETVSEQKAQIAGERDDVAAQLHETRLQLEALGIEGGVQGLTQQIARLTEERTQFKNQFERAARDREVLLKERQKLEDAINREAERDAQLQALEEEVARLLADREAFSKNRDSIRAGHEALEREREEWYGERARMLAHNDSLKMELDETIELLNRANQDRQQLAGERNQLSADHDKLTAELASLQTERDTLLARAEGDRDRLEELGSEGVGTLTSMIDSLTQERARLEVELLNVQQRAESLQRQLNHMRHAAEADPASLPLAVDIEVIMSLAQELRSPLSVVMGYTDTILNESVGILGALQRKLLTRVKANVDRLSQLIEELVQVVALDSGDLKLQPQKINLVDIIDDAITASRYKFSEKGIVLDMDIPDDYLYAQADVEALRQIFSHLMQNAYLVSPTDGTVQVKARYERDYSLVADNDSQEVIYVAISDHGGGVSPEDAKRVFSRLYRADNPLIIGIGDTGVGMSITKALIEAHGGKIWLETDPGVGNTFQFVLPTELPQIAAAVGQEAAEKSP